MRTKFSGILTLFLALFVQILFAQQQTVSGTVTDDTGLPLPGATVTIKGTTTGKITDFNGKYSIKASNGQTLVFSYVGFSSEEVKVTSGIINVVLKEGEALEVVVVEAYRTSTKATSNIASTTITAETIQARPNPSIIQTLQGQVAGLNIATGNGQPGANSQINLRGVGSINGDTEPLFIIDGVPVDEDNFRSINPNEISSLSVLKDAGATAIYGNRGANGVIIIKTKRGSFNQGLKIGYIGITGFSTLQGNDYDLMDAREQLFLENSFGSGFGSSLSSVEIELRAQQANTNWADVFFGTGVSNSHTINLSSGGENLSSFTSLGYFDQEGILSGASTLQRFNFRNNINYKSDDEKLTVNTGLSLNYSKSAEPNSLGTGGVNQNFILGAYQSVPYISPLQYVPGQGRGVLLGGDYTLFSNTPLLLLDKLDTFTREEDELKILANINVNYKFTDQLTFSSTFGGDFTDERRLTATSPIAFNSAFFAEDGNDTPGRTNLQSNRSLALNFNNVLTYRNTFADKHTVEATIGTEYFKAHWKDFGFTNEGENPAIFSPGDGASFIDDNSDNDFFTNAVNATERNAGLFSYFGYVDYDYDQKYGFSATYRRDASYRFASSNRWGSFYSVSGRWTISNEEFMQDTAFNLLKLRGSYGTTGNQNINTIAGPFKYFVASDLTEDFFGSGTAYGGVNGLSVSQLGNSDLKWETIVQSNIGLDFEVFNRRLRGSVDVYEKTTEDLFINRALSPALNGGFSFIDANVGELSNRGVELDIHYDLIKQEDFNLTLNFNGAYNKQEIISLGDAGDQIDNGLFIGGPLNQYFATRYAGVNPANGNLLFLDINGNVTESPVDADRVQTGKNVFPDYQGSFGFNADYKGFYLNTQFNYTVGVDRFDFELSSFQDPTNIGNFRSSRDLLRAWQNVGDVTDIPSLRATNLALDANSDRYIKEADYLRLRFVEFGYAVPQQYLKKTGLTTARLFVNAENLVTFSKWRGFDAEATTGTGSRLYPTPKIVSLGIELGF